MQRTSVVVGHERCPACEKVGRDRKGDNLAVYSDGHKYCFACGYMERSRYSLANIRAGLQKSVSNTHRSTLAYSGSTEFLSAPKHVREYVANLRLTPEIYREYRLTWDENKKLLLWSLFSGTSLLFYSGRYFGTDPKHPKYVSGGSRIAAVRELLGRPCTKQARVLVFTEDVVSAIKAQYECGHTRGDVRSCPLFGTTIHIPTLLQSGLSRDTIIKLWLDNDKAVESLRQASRIRQWFPNTSTIVSKKDPKYYTKKEMNEFVFGNPEGILELSTVEQVP